MLRHSENLAEFVVEPVPEGGLVKCCITRDKKGIDRGLFPTYYLHLEREGGKPVFLLAARKRRKLPSSSYLISTDPTDLTSREGDTAIGTLTSNILGAKFYLVGKEGQRSIHSERSSSESSSDHCEIDRDGTCLAEVHYNMDVLGIKGPRKMKVLLRNMTSQGCTHLRSKTPTWDQSLNSFVLNFYGRAHQASVKNFQLIDERQPDMIVLQFGKLTEEKFILDFRNPMSVLQAFGIALSSFDCKIACE